jgi:hypothetical protein
MTASGTPERVERTLSAAGLIDALDRLIADGVTITGDIVIGIGEVDLIRLDLRALLIGIQGSAS